MKKTFFLPLIFLFFLIYYFLFPVTTDPEMIMSPLAAIDLSRVDGRSLIQLEKPLRVPDGEYRGVLFPQGKSIVMEESPARTDFSESHILIESPEGEYSLRNMINRKTVRFGGKGHPLVLGSHYLLTDIPGGYLQEVDPDGNALWSWDGVSPVTALAAGNLCVAFGSLDGRVRIFGKDGSVQILEPVTDEADRIIYGAALSADSSTLAVVAGLEQQTLIFYEKRAGKEYSEVSRFPLDSHYRRTVRMYLTAGGDFLWIEQPAGLRRYTASGPGILYGVEGGLLSVKSLEDQGLILILSTAGRNRTLLSLRSVDGTTLYEDRLDAIPASFDHTGSQLSLVTDGNLLLLTREVY